MTKPEDRDEGPTAASGDQSPAAAGDAAATGRPTTDPTRTGPGTPEPTEPRRHPIAAGAVDGPASTDEALEAALTGSLDGILHAGRLAGLSPESLSQVFGTPFYVYDLDLIGRRVDALRAVLPTGFRIAFAVKSNPALAIVAHLRRCGVGADVASAGELATVLRAGFAAGDVAMTGPGKRDEELEVAVASGVGVITVESMGELRRLESIAARLLPAGRRQKILLRLAVADDARLETVRLIGGVEGKFGMPLPALREAAAVAATSPHVELLGLHAFGASNLRDADQLAGHVEQLVDVAGLVMAEVSLPLRLVDAGGGLGITYSDGEQPLDLRRFGRRLADLRRRWDGIPETAGLEVILEPGRFLVGPAGAYVARVVDVKGPDSAPVAILDGGINHVVRPALVRTEHRLAVLATDQIRALVPVTVAGPLCTGVDVFATGAHLPRPRVGDLVAVLDVGAYGFTESMPWFLSHPTAAEVAVKAGAARLIRPHIDPQEMLERQIDPDWEG